MKICRLQRSWWEPNYGWKQGWKDYEEPMLRPNYFSYCVTSDIVGKIKALVPPYCGLYWVDGEGKLHCDHAPAQLHKEKYLDTDLGLMQKFYFHYLHLRRALDDTVMSKNI